MTYVVEELVVEKLVVLGELPVVMKVRSYCELLFSREWNVTGRERERERRESRWRRGRSYEREER